MRIPGVLRAFQSRAQVYIVTTSTAPPSSLGKNGDWTIYLGDAASSIVVYGPKIGGAWPSTPVNNGPSGPSGGLGVWTTGTVYTAGACTTTAGVLLVCNTSHTASADIHTDIALGYWSQIAGAQGRIETVDPALVSSTTTNPTASRWSFYRVRGTGSVSKVGYSVTISSGNVAVAAYANSGTGTAAAPGALLATSGSVACPSAGYVETALGAAVGVLDGDWLAIGIDNTTASLRAATTQNAGEALWGGRAVFQNVGSLTAPTTPATSPGLSRTFYLRGVA